MKAARFKKSFCVEVVARQGVRFPLTLTLSRREKEQPLIHFVKRMSHEAEAAFSFAMKARRDFAKNRECFSFSPRERAGVRGNKTTKLQAWNN